MRSSMIKHWKEPNRNCEMKDKTELRNSIDDFNSRLKEAEERVSKLEDWLIEIIQLEEQKGKKKWKGRRKAQRRHHQKKYVCIIGVSEGEEREKRIRSIFE